MFRPITKLAKVIKRDGFWYTSKRTLAWTIAHSPLAYKLSFPYYQQTRLVFAPSMLIYRIFASRKTRQSDLTVMQKYVQTGSTVIDVGANAGTITVPAGALVSATGKVLSFEPSPKFAKIIKANIAVNNFSDRISLYEVALGSETGTVYLDETVADDTTNHIAQSGTAVKQKTLDHYTQDIETVDFLKIDVEGYELDVLRGASQTLAKTKCLYIEFIPAHLKRADADPEAVLAILNQHFTLHTKTVDGLTPFTYNPNATQNPDLVCLRK